MIKAPKTTTAASTEKLVMAATLQESGGSAGGPVNQRTMLLDKFQKCTARDSALLILALCFDCFEPPEIQ